MSRPSWDNYFMRMAEDVATRATCPRKHVGAVIVRDRMILSTGYNGSIRGTKHCEEVGCLMIDNHCARTIHAEQNAIVQAAKNGVRIEGADLYVTASPCWHCFKLTANAGIKRVVFGEFYRDESVFAAAAEIGIELIHLNRRVLTASELSVGDWITWGIKRFGFKVLGLKDNQIEVEGYREGVANLINPDKEQIFRVRPAPDQSLDSYKLDQ